MGKEAFKMSIDPLRAFELVSKNADVDMMHEETLEQYIL